jgi:choline dehydrogenase
MWVRGSPEDYNGWGAQNPGWSFADVLPYFKSLENNTNKYAQNPGYHGNSGPLSITGNVMTPRIQPFIDAAESLGMSFNPDINGANIITSALGSVGRIDVTAVNGVRQNAYQSFLRPLVLAGQDNLFVRDQSYVLRINFKDKVAKSVDWIDLKTNEVQTTKARKEIILSLGALHSAQILMLSGVGDASELAAAGVQELVHHLPGVGKNLQDHPIATMSVMSTNLPACGTSPGGDPRVDLFFRTGLRGETDGRPDVEVIGGNSCGYSFALVYLMTPKSRGEVKLVNSDPTSRPKVVMNYFTDPENYDLRALAEGMRLTQKFYQAAPLNGFTLEKWPAGGAPLNYSDYNVVSDYILGTTTGTANSNSGMHMAGTLKMGPASDPMAVVDHRLRVRGIDKLRVLDNSIQPEITCGNIQAPAYLIGEKGAAMILQDN